MTEKEQKLLQELLVQEAKEKSESKKKQTEFTFEIVEHIETLSTYTDEKGEVWTKEVNRVSFNGSKALLDIRTWNKEHTRMGKGIRLNAEEEEKLIESMTTEPIPMNRFH